MTNEALVQKQVELEKLYSKNQLLPRIRNVFESCKSFNFVKYFEEKSIPKNFGFDVMVQIYLHKQADVKTMVGVMWHHLGDPQSTVDMLYKCVAADLLDWNGPLKKFKVRHCISDAVQQELDAFQFPLPMVVEPTTLKNNRDNGYLLGRGSVILKNNHHEDDVCLDHLNRMNRIKFCINTDVVQFVKNSWKGLDRKKDGEDANKYEQRKAAFAKYDRVAKQVIGTLTELGNEFYLTHRYDKRGRTYSSGYHVNYQGNPWNKACVELAEKEIIE
jgi:hypothetical protein